MIKIFSILLSAVWLLFLVSGCSSTTTVTSTPPASTITVTSTTQEPAVTTTRTATSTTTKTTATTTTSTTTATTTVTYTPPPETTPAPNPFHGIYTGTWTGMRPNYSTEMGAFSFVIDRNGGLQGLFIISDTSYTGTLTGQADSGGNFSAEGTARIVGTTRESTWKGKISVSGNSSSVEGDWSDPYMIGIFSGTGIVTP